MSDAAQRNGDQGLQPDGQPEDRAGAWREVAPTARREPAALEELRGLLVGTERARLSALEARPLKPEVEDVAALLPDAVRRRVARDADLARALSTTIEAGLERSARKNPKALAEAIHPALGPAIRKAIQSALAQALEAFNVALENSLSPRGLAWRVEALRTGRPFAEVVLLKSLVYRVEQVFLIHRKSGVLLAEAANPAALRKDPELVSSMLSAIRDFAVDSFGGSPDDELDRIDLAGLCITLVGSPDAVLAAVVRGTPPESLRTQLEGALEELTEKRAADLARFSGDTAPFQADAHLLEDCLGGEQRVRRRSPLVAAAAPALAVVALVWLGLWLWRQHGMTLHRAAVVDALRAAPGLLVLGTEEHRGALTIRGLADPLAVAPADVARAAAPERGLEGVNLEFAPFDAPGAELAEQRLRARLLPPPGVQVTVDAEGIARLAGAAPTEWVARALAVAPAVPGVRGLDAAGLVDYDRAQLFVLAEGLQGVAARFPLGRADLGDGAVAADEIAASLADIAARAARVGAVVCVRLTPERHPLEEASAALAQRRAAALRALIARACAARGADALVFELAAIIDGEVPIGETGAVEVEVAVLGVSPDRGPEAR